MSRASWQTTAVRPAPALHPATATPPGRPPSDSALSATHRSAAMASSTAAGYGLRRVPVIRREDDCGASDAEVPAQRIIRNGIAHHPAAAVEVQDDGVRAGR